jgi:hypothetical protein
MCTQVHPRQVEHDMKEPLNARVYIDGKNRPLFVSTPYGTVQDQIQAGAHGLVVTDLSGEVITVPMGRVQSAAQASEPAATRRYARAVRLICQAESIEIRAQQAEAAMRAAVAPSSEITQAILTEDQQNAVAFLESGDEGSVRAAINIAGREFVESYLRERLTTKVIAYLSNGGSGRVFDYDPSERRFAIDVDPADVPTGVLYPLEDIERLDIGA